MPPAPHEGLAIELTPEYIALANEMTSVQVPELEPVYGSIQTASTLPMEEGKKFVTAQAEMAFHAEQVRRRLRGYCKSHLPSLGMLKSRAEKQLAFIDSGRVHSFGERRIRVAGPAGRWRDLPVVSTVAAALLGILILWVSDGLNLVTMISRSSWVHTLTETLGTGAPILLGFVVAAFGMPVVLAQRAQRIAEKAVYFGLVLCVLLLAVLCGLAWSPIDPFNPNVVPTWVVYILSLLTGGFGACVLKVVLRKNLSSLFSYEIRCTPEYEFYEATSQHLCQVARRAETLRLRLEEILSELEKEKERYIQINLMELTRAQAYISERANAARLEFLPIPNAFSTESSGRSRVHQPRFSSNGVLEN